MSGKFILASSSPRRIGMIRDLGIEFEVIIPQVDEIHPEGELPGELVVRLSVEKAADVASRIEEKAVILAADTVVILGDTILGKPVDEADAMNMLKILSANTHRVATGFAILNERAGVLHTEAVFTDVTFKNLERSEIEGYIKTGEPMDKAGSYAIQGKGSFMVKEINGSFTNVVGLPLDRVVDVLSSHNLLELFKRNGN